MIKRKRKAFTIVELVIVIAVIAILAAVLIPTFASIINKANESADIQAVRQMNMALMAESATEKPTELKKVIEILDKAGYNSEKNLTPVSKDHGFYWHSGTNTILLVKDPAGKSAELIFPLDNQTLTSAFDAKKTNWSNENGHVDFYDLEDGSNYLSKNTVTVNNPESVADINAAIAGALAADTPNVVIEFSDEFAVNGKIDVLAGTTVTFNLNGKTLTIGDASISVSGTLNINGGTNGGTIYTTAGYDGETPLGLVVNSTGTLNLNNMTVTVGTGAKHALYNDGGTVTATDCIFNEAAGATISYEYRAPIFNVGGTIYMERVDISSSNYCTSGYPSNTALGTITIDVNSRLKLTGEKNVAPRRDHYAYNYHYLFGPTDNDNGVVFECYAPADEDVSKDVTITLTADKTWDRDRYFAKKVTIDLSGWTFTLHDTYITCEELIITDSVGGGTLELKSSRGHDFEKFFDVTKLTLSGKEENNLKVSKSRIDLFKITEIIKSGVVLENCLFNDSFNDIDIIAVNKEGVISLKSDASIISDISIPEEKTVTIDLNGKTLSTSKYTITVPDTSTLNITNTAAATTSQINSIGTTNIFNVQAGGNLNLGKVEDGNLNLGKVELVNEHYRACFLSYIMNNSSITASDVSIEGKATLNKSIAEDGKITNTLTLTGNLTLGKDLTVSGNNTLEIVFNNYSLNSYDYAIIVKGGGKLIVNAQTAKGTGSFTVETGGTIEISNKSTIDKAITVNEGTLKVSGGSTINKAITVNKGTLEVSDDSTSTVNAKIAADSESKVTLRNANVKMSQADFFNLLTVVMESNDSTMTTVNFSEGSTSTHYLTVNKAGDKKAAIVLINTFTLSQLLTIPVGCDVTLDMYHREIQIGATLGTPVSIVVNGTLTINGGNIRTIDSSKITVTATGKLVLNAKNYYGTYDSSAEFLGCVTVAPGGTVYICGATADVIKSYVVGILNGSISATNATFADADGNTTTVSITDGVVTITLGNDLTLSDITVSGSNKIDLNGKKLTIGSGFAIADGSTLTVESGTNGGTFVYGENTINVEAGKTYNVTIVDGTVTATPT